MNVSPFGKLEVENTPEIRRIAALPRRVWTDEAGVKLAAAMTRELRRPGGMMELRPIQAVALFEAMKTRGLFAPIRVGHGKTLVGWLCPAVLEAKRPLLLVPAALLTKTWDDYKVLVEHWRLPTNVQLASYESLGLVQSAERLEYIKPDLIVADEAHMIKNHKAGRTRRVIRYMKGHPDTRFVGMSGTIMKSSLRDFTRFLRWALGNQAPVPMTDDEVACWADCLDEKVNPIAWRKPGALFKLGPVPSGVDSVTAARRVFQARLLETQGVVASAKTDKVSCSLRISALEYRLSEVTEGHFNTLRTLWETPCGRSFTEATEMRMYLRELALGFTYTWIPREKVAEWDALLRQSKKQQGPQPASVGEKRIQIKQQLSQNGGAIPTRNSSTNRNESKSEEPLVNGGQRRMPNTSELLRRFGRETTKNVLTSTGLLENTGSPQSNIEPCQQAKEASAQFAGKLTANKDSALTTITLLEESEGSYATSATSESESLETIALGLSEPLRTFLEQNRPPPPWLNARREWSSFVREQISKSQKYDTMLQVANACRAGSLDSRALDQWQAIENTYQPLTRPIFYDVAALEACLDWMTKHVGIVWVEHQAFGQALSRFSGASYFGAKGLDGSGASIKDEKGNRSVIASIIACKQGFNLQMFSKNLIPSFPSGALVVEQTLGRTHRDGQEADEVLVDVLLGCREHFESFGRAKDEARAAADLLGHDQKILLSDFVLPSIANRTGPLWV